MVKIFASSKEFVGEFLLRKAPMLGKARISQVPASRKPQVFFAAQFLAAGERLNKLSGWATIGTNPVEA